MKRHILAANETLEQVSGKYGVPICMIARVNAGFKAGLAAGTAIDIPPRCFCALFGGRYTIAGEDETLLDISLRTCATMRDILRINDICPSDITPGMMIFLPPPCRIYTVGATDTLDDIAKKSGICADELRRINDIDAGVYRGMQIKLY